MLEFACRKGSCGACRVQLISGAVSYIQEVTAPVEEGEVLLCCAVPARDANKQAVQLSVKL